MNFKNFKYIIYFLPALFFSCSDEDSMKTSSEGDEQVVFGARIREMGNTRADDKPVKNKSMNLTFFTSNGFEKGKVEFNDQGIGFSVRYDADQNPLDLVWSYVSPNERNGKVYSFFIDNLDSEYTETDPQNPTTVILPSNNRYKLGLYVDEDKEDPEKGIYSNDLQWGSLENVERDKIETIYLNHVMARFSLRVTFDNSAVGEEFKPESASINNIFHEAVSFDRKTGILGLPDQPEADPFYLVETKEGWKAEKDEEDGITYYNSPDFAVPPQEFVANARPRVTVKLTNGKSYSGLLPTAMSILGENSSSLWTMAFLKGYKLTLNVKISNEAASLEFMPVTVMEWWEVGRKTLMGNQASLTKDEDFDELIKAYKNSDDSEFYRWGYYDNVNQVWVFNIFRALEIDPAKYKSVMQEKESMPYRFNILNTSIALLYPGGIKKYVEGEEGERILKEILSEGIIPSAE